jgi:hypothetical protein
MRRKPSSAPNAPTSEWVVLPLLARSPPPLPHHAHPRTSPTTTPAGVFGQWCNDKRAANEAAKGGGPAVEEWLQEVFTNRDPRGKPLRAFLDPTPDA